MRVTSQNRIPLLQNGTVDLECGSTTNNAARKQQVAFAVTTYVTEARFAVKAASGITSAEQLFGKTVATTTGTTLIQRLRKLERDNNTTFNLVYGRTTPTAFCCWNVATPMRSPWTTTPLPAIFPTRRLRKTTE